MNELQIALSQEVLDEGPDYEKATFGLLEIKAQDQILTAATRAEDNGNRWVSGPYVSGYHLAEWLVWNWWRLRWEPPLPRGTASYDWNMSHRMPNIGEGYFWPNITIESDGLHCDLASRGSDPSDSPYFFYNGADLATIPANDFESAVDLFVACIMDRLRGEGIRGTNLQTLWDDLAFERKDPESARYRRIEAMLGFDPDEAKEEMIEGYIRDKDQLGENSLEELAAATFRHMVSALQIANDTKSLGYELNVADGIHVTGSIHEQWGLRPAWRVGVATATAVRQEAGFTDEPISDQKLAGLAGISESSLISRQCSNRLSWVMRQDATRSRAVFGSSWHTNRRFALARLIGDRLFGERGFTVEEPLTPATRSFSYRQKAQRAFAAELLSPWELVEGMLSNDYSKENQKKVAAHFVVSEMAISTSVVNRTGIGREELQRWMTT